MIFTKLKVTTIFMWRIFRKIWGSMEGMKRGDSIEIKFNLRADL